MKTTLNNSLLALVILATSLIPSIIHAQQSDTDTSGAPTCAIISNNLRYGARDSGSSSDVSILQDFLNTKGYLSSAPTGFFGHLTMNAVKAFQSANGISPTGFVGTLTRAKIQAIDCNGATTSSSSNTATVTTTTPVNPSTTAVQNTPVSVNNYPIITYSSQTPVNTPTTVSITPVSVPAVVQNNVSTNSSNQYYNKPYMAPSYLSYNYVNSTTTFPTDLCSLIPIDVVKSALNNNTQIVQMTHDSKRCQFDYGSSASGYANAVSISILNTGSTAPSPWSLFSNDSLSFYDPTIIGPGYELVWGPTNKTNGTHLNTLSFFKKGIYGMMLIYESGTDDQIKTTAVNIAKAIVPNLPLGY